MNRRVAYVRRLSGGREPACHGCASLSLPVWVIVRSAALPLSGRADEVDEVLREPDFIEGLRDRPHLHRCERSPCIDSARLDRHPNTLRMRTTCPGTSPCSTNHRRRIDHGERQVEGAEGTREAMRSGKSVLDLVRERKLLSEEQIQKLMDVKALTGQR